MRDPYLVLDVARDASEAEIRGAYRRLVKRFHPDLNPDDYSAAQRFREIQQAYALLKHKDKRAAFDAGEIDARGQPQFRSLKPELRRAAQGRWESSAHPDKAKIRSAELLAELFAGLKRGAQGDSAESKPVVESLALTFEEAARGVCKALKLATGETLMVTVPPGVQDGQVLRLKARRDGQSGRGGRRAIHVKLTVAPHQAFTREGLNLKLELPVSLGEAVLGGKVRVPTLDGAVVVTVPEGSNTGTVLKLRGKGLSLGSAQGDLFVTLKVVLPPLPDPVLKAFVMGWQADHIYDPRAKL